MDLFPPLHHGIRRASPEGTLTPLLLGHEHGVAGRFDDFAQEAICLGGTLLLLGTDCAGVSCRGDNGCFGGESGEALGEVLGEEDAED